MTYIAPLAEQIFALQTSAAIADIAALPRFASVTDDLVEAVLGEAARFAEDVFAPLNRVGDQQGARWNEGEVTLPAGFREAYARYVEAGWNTLGADPDAGGQGLPFAVSAVMMEMLQAANMAFALCPMLTLGAIEALQAHGSPEQKARYLGKLVSGEWTGTMNLTEPQAGSDVGALRARAEPLPDGRYSISGQKIFITWGEHDCAANIVHLVLARLPDAPPGTRGISLFVVPKFLVDEAGAPGTRNDLRCIAIEHKLGIHASPTCAMSFGDEGSCIGELVGAPHAGMRAMFTMMNHARVNVGLQGVGIAERAYQAARAYAAERVQSARFGGAREAVPIAEHADVRRMLMTMKASIEAARAIAYRNAAAIDLAHASPEGSAAKGLADLLTPVTKAYATDIGVEVASLAIQIFGGMGYIEESGAPQHLRDARIAPIYEGTNGIQALDLVGRKLPQDGGAHWRALFAEIDATISAVKAETRLAPAGPALSEALAALREATDYVVAILSAQADDVAAAASPYLRLFAMTAGGHLLALQALEACRRLDRDAGDSAFLREKIGTARFFIEQMVPPATTLLPAIKGSAAALGFLRG